MQVGIGLPSVIEGTPGDLILDWARQAEEKGFSSLGLIDRLVYGNYETLIALTAAAAVTRRIRLMTTILIGPLHSPALLAKQTASLDALSNGRLTLGLAVGGREDDYKAAGVDFHSRGKLFDQQLETMKKIWSGQPLGDDIGPIGPAPVSQGGPELLIGASSPQALQRVARWGSGFISGGGGPEAARKTFDTVENIWKEAGREGKPRFVAGQYFALGEGAAEAASHYINHYYSFLGPVADRIASTVPTTPEAVKATLKAFEDAGLDEVIMWPCVADLRQVELLADLI